MIVTDSFVISIGYLIIFLMVGIRITNKFFIKQFFPITFENNWFITCYIIMYLTHGILNKIIEVINKRQYLNIIFGSMFLYCILEIVVSSNYRYCDMLGFWTIYMFAGYIKKYNIRKQYNWKKIFIISSFILIMTVILTDYFGTISSIFSDKVLKWCRFNNIIIIVMAFSLLFIALETKFYSKRINLISSTSLLVYLIHENELLSMYAKPIVWKFICERFNNSYLAFYTLVIAMFLFVGSVVIAIVYKNTFGKVAEHISKIVFVRIKNIYDNVIEKCYE